MPRPTEEDLARYEAALQAIADQFLAHLRQHERERRCKKRPCMACRQAALAALGRIIGRDSIAEMRDRHA